MADAATSIDVLEAASVEPFPQPASLPGMTDRVTGGVPGHNTAAEGLAAMTATQAEHAPVVRYTLRDCLVHQGGVEFAGGLWPRTGAWKDRLPLGKIEKVAAGSYCMRPSSWQYFGHWLRDACPTALLACDDEELFLDARPDWPDTTSYASAFGLKTRPPTVASIDTLHVYSDFAQGALKRRRYATLRDRLRQKMGPANGNLRPVYLSRGTSGARRTIENEGDLCDRLSRAGFDIIDSPSLDFATRYYKLACASVVVTIEGSHLNHAYFAMQPGTSLLVLMPGNRLSPNARGASHAIGLRFGYVILEAVGANYLVNPDEVLGTLDLLM